MKIRKGFVSNSSSSSFVLSADCKLEDIEITIPLKLTDIVETVIKTKEELDKYLFEEQEYNINKFDKTVYDSYIEQLKLGRILLMGTVSNEYEGRKFDHISSHFLDNGFHNVKFNHDITVVENPSH